MNVSIVIMEEEHSNINRALAVVRNICLGLMNGRDVPDADFRQIIDFIRGYAETMPINTTTERKKNFFSLLW